MLTEKTARRHLRHHIEVCEIECIEGGNTIWVHSPKGGTVLRIKCTGKIKIQKCGDNPVSHGDIMVEGDIELCVTSEDLRRRH